MNLEFLLAACMVQTFISGGSAAMLMVALVTDKTPYFFAVTFVISLFIAIIHGITINRFLKENNS